MNIFQKIKSGMLISGAVLIVAGLVLLFFPVTTTKMIAYIAAAMLLFMGIGQVIGYFRYEPGSGRYSSGLVLGIFLMIVGLLIYYKAEVVVSIIPIILGVVILFSGFSKLQQAVDLARMKARRWTTVLATACLNLILGGVIIFNPFSTAMTLLRFVGIGCYTVASPILSQHFIFRARQRIIVILSKRSYQNI